MLFRSGFRPALRKAIMYRPAEPYSPVATDLRIERVGVEHAAGFADLCATLFAMPEPVKALLAGTFTKPEWRQWMAFDGEVPVATKMTFIKDGVAWHGWNATKASHRRRAAFAALNVAGALEVVASGCRWMTTEANVGSSGSPDIVYRDDMKRGWRLAYERPVYLRAKRTASR